MREILTWVVLLAAFVAACGVIWRSVFRPIVSGFKQMLDFAERGIAALDKVEHELTANSGTSLKDAFVAMKGEVTTIKEQLRDMPVLIARIDHLELRQRDPETRERATDPNPTPPVGVKLIAAVIEPSDEEDMK